jgi:protein involved in polysaccharide export with SLBB domain
MLSDMLSKAGICLTALLAFGWIDHLPTFANWGEDAPSVSTVQADIQTSNSPTRSTISLVSATPGQTLDDTAARPPGLLGRMLSGDTCDYDVDQADWVVAGDNINLRIFVDAGTGSERFERRDLSGSFSVDRNGEVALPAIGRVAAADRPLACLEEPVAKALETEMGISAKVTASFETRPPVLIQGTVIAPGSYEYTPNMTVSALLVKAGAGGGSAESALFRSLEARGQELRTLRAGLLLKSARLSAQRAGAKDLSLSPANREDLRRALGRERIESEVAVLLAADAERTLRAAQVASLRDELDASLAMALQRQSLVQARFDALRARRDALDLELGKACRGRCGSVRRYDELRLDSLNSRLADIDLSVQEAETRVTKARHVIVSHDRTVSLTFGEADSELSLDYAETLGALSALEAEIGAINSQVLDIGASAGHVVRVERRRGSEALEFNARDNDPLLPGDTVTVAPAGDEMIAFASGSDQ